MNYKLSLFLGLLLCVSRPSICMDERRKGFEIPSIILVDRDGLAHVSSPRPKGTATPPFIALGEIPPDGVPSILLPKIGRGTLHKPTGSIDQDPLKAVLEGKAMRFVSHSRDASSPDELPGGPLSPMMPDSGRPAMQIDGRAEQEKGGRPVPFEQRSDDFAFPVTFDTQEEAPELPKRSRLAMLVAAIKRPHKS